MKFPLMGEPFPRIHLKEREVDELIRTSERLVTQHLQDYDAFVNEHKRVLRPEQWRHIKSREQIHIYKSVDKFPPPSPPDPVSVTASHSQHSTSSHSSHSTSSTIRPTQMTRASSSSASSASASSSSSPFESRESMISAATSGGMASSQQPSGGGALLHMAVEGYVVGSLEDVLYGAIAADGDGMKVKSSYLTDEMLDQRVLHAMRVPTEEHPFESLILKWCVQGSGNAMMRARDYVFLEHTGMRSLATGERVGFQFMHSVELPHCGPLATTDVVRGKQSVCHLLVERADHTVELHARAWYDAGGSAIDKLATKGAVHALLSTWKWNWCGENKKLAWLLRWSAGNRQRQMQAKTNGMARQSATDPQIALLQPQQQQQQRQCQQKQQQQHLQYAQPRSGSEKCALCTKSVSMFRTLTTCELCLSAICARCLISRSLQFVRHTGDVVAIPTRFCKECVTHATALQPGSILVHEYAEIAHSLQPTGVPVASDQEARSDSNSNSNSNSNGGSRRAAWQPSPELLTDSACHRTELRLTKQQVNPPAAAAQGAMDETFSKRMRALPERQDEDTDSSWETGSASSSSTATTTMTHGDDAQSSSQRHQQELWWQMNQLRVAAEEAYQLAKQNARAMNEPSA